MIVAIDMAAAPGRVFAMNPAIPDHGGSRQMKRPRTRGLHATHPDSTANYFGVSTCCNSPDWNISAMMSEPPTNSPFT